MADSLILWLLALTKGLCLLNCLLNYVKQRVNSFKFLVLKGHYNSLHQDESMISLMPMEPMVNETGLGSLAQLTPY